ncbi:MAG: L-threonylcarbamoyladenylate synthase [Candidatus Hydrothermales bacterium]
MESKDKRKELRKAIEILKKGGVIAIPTDTVSGFVTPYWSSEGVKRIFSIKERETEKKFGLFISDPKELNIFTKNLTETRKRLVYNLWPGPISFLFKAKERLPDYIVHKEKKTVSVRIPNHSVPISLCKEAGPLVQTSVNISGQKEINDYTQIEKEFGKYIDFVYPQNSPGTLASTIIDLSKYPFILVRKGPIGIAQIENILLRKIKISKSIKTNILFVCTGNSCRSPMAMGIMHSLLKPDLKELIDIRSAGTEATSGLPISENTIRILKERYNLDLSHYKTRRLSREDLEWADFVYVMEKRHLREIQKMGFYEKVRLLNLVDKSKEIPDPLGKDYKFYLFISKLIEKNIKRIIKELEYRYS